MECCHDDGHHGWPACVASQQLSTSSNLHVEKDSTLWTLLLGVSVLVALNRSPARFPLWLRVVCLWLKVKTDVVMSSGAVCLRMASLT